MSCVICSAKRRFIVKPTLLTVEVGTFIYKEVELDQPRSCTDQLAIETYGFQLQLNAI
jgi:hypothetical protein